MNYQRRDAKDYAREHFKGIWAAALTPFAPNLALDEAGLRRNPVSYTHLTLPTTERV